MQLTAVIMLVLTLSVSAKVNSQKITLSGKNISIEKVFEEIEKQTNYVVIASADILFLREKVHVDAREMELKEFLDIILKGKPLAFEINGETIFIKEKVVEINDDLNRRLDAHPPITVRGRIINEKGEPVIVSVIIKGTKRGTTTDINGNFELLNVDENALLVITGTNIETREINVSGKEFVVINTVTKVSSEEEVVVNAGYYNVKDKERTGSISRVNAKTIEQQPVVNPLLALSGRMPGVFIQQTTGTPGGNIKIQIRGRNSLRPDGSEPLYIIDGVPFSMDRTFSASINQGSTFGQYGGMGSSSTVNPLTSINNADIESIEVLKDADATAVYGSRGANGVVLITTKKGKPGKTKFALNVYNGIGIARRLDLLNTQEYLQLRYEAFNNDGITPSSDPSDPGYAPDLTIWDTSRYTDWQKEFLGAARTTSAQGSLSGGNAQTKYLVSVGYRKENSIYSNDQGYQKVSFHLSLNNQSLDRKFNFSTSVSGSKDKNDQPILGLVQSRTIPPNAPELYTSDGKLNWAESTWVNPLANAEIIYGNNAVNVTANSVISYELLSGLQLKSSFGINYLNSNEKINKPSTYFDPALGDNSNQVIVQKSYGTNQSWIIEPQITWDKQILKGKFSALVGSTFQDQQLQRTADLYLGFDNDDLMDNIASARLYSNYENVSELYRYSAAFGRINYNWDGKYIINLTARRDGSSRFGPRKQFSNFGAVGLAWVFSEENWFSKFSNIINLGKLRTSYGTTGNDQIGNYQYLDTYSPSTSTEGNDYQGVTILRPMRLYNPDYAWEINKKFEAAIELGLLNNSMFLQVSYYHNRSSNQLVNYTLPQITGFNGILANLPATVQNTGWEFEITSKNIKSKSAEWTTSFNLTIPHNELVAFPNLESSTYVNQYVIGMPLSIGKFYHSLGIDTQTGLWTFEDVNKDGDITSEGDRKFPVFIGQQYYGGLNNSFSYKNFSLDIFFQFVKQTGLGGALSDGMLERCLICPDSF